MFANNRIVSILVSKQRQPIHRLCRSTTSRFIHTNNRLANEYVIASSTTSSYHETLLLQQQCRRNMVTITKTSASTSSSPKVEINTNNNTSLNLDINNNNESSSSLTSNVIQDRNEIIITSSAIQQINHLAKMKNPNNPSNIYLRVYVDAGGCSGFQYKFELENKENDDNPIDLDDDIVFHAKLSNEGNGNTGNDSSMECEVVVDKGSLEFLEGSKVDFVREMVKSSFAVVENPKSESACGCGSSFAMKNFESNPALD